MLPFFIHNSLFTYPVMKVLPLAITSLFAVPIYATDVENVTVTSSRPYYYDTLEQIFPQQTYPVDETALSGYVNDSLLRSPVISLNGQGGLLQNVSVRGFSRWRVQTLLDGVPIISDRRAGSSYGFLSSDFLSSILVLPGAASTYLGSGAIGGATDIQISRAESPVWKLQWGSNQQNHGITYSDASDNTDWKLTYRKAENGEDANGNTLYNQFTQRALFVRHNPESGPVDEIWSLYSTNDDVGKSSSDFPNDRITIYPSNSHWLGKARFSVLNHSGSFWWHQSSLETSTLRVDSRINDSKNQALDFGADIGNKHLLGRWKTNWQIKIAGRDGVKTDEAERTLTDELTYKLTTLDATELTVNGLFDASTSLSTTALAWGMGVSWNQQKQRDIAIYDNNLSGFIGLSHPIGNHWLASVYWSSAYRVPSLTERFYRGETPRGIVIGDTSLDTEQANNVQSTLSYTNTHIQGNIELFHQHISNYIERIEVAEATLRYSNLDSATINGLSFEVNWQSEDKRWMADLSGAWIKGQDHANNPLQDIPPHKLRLDISRMFSNLRIYTALNYRAEKTNIGDSERELRNVTTLNAGGEWQVSQTTAIGLRLQNLTNQSYSTTADDRAPFALGRNIEMSLSVSL